MEVGLAGQAMPIHGTEYETIPLLTDHLFAAQPKHHRYAKRSSLALRDLHVEPFLLLRDGHCFRDTAVAACGRARLNPRIVFLRGRLTSIFTALGPGVGVSVVPHMHVAQRSEFPLFL